MHDAVPTNINWFPGHMKKTEDIIKKNLNLCDGVIEVIDARIPLSSQNPDIDFMARNKPRIILLNKSDLADKLQTEAWISYFTAKGFCALSADCKTGKGLKDFPCLVRHVFEDKIKIWQSKGIVNRSIKLMVVGIPNVGKSSFINRLARKNKAQVEDRPGVTRQKQWYTLAKSIEVLDTPGVLWPRFSSYSVALNLAITGAIKENILQVQELAVSFLDILKENPIKSKVFNRYKLGGTFIDQIDSYELLRLIAVNKNLLIDKLSPDLDRAAKMLIYDFRSGVLGRITLEKKTGEQ